ncbi:LptF/LptG family permease [Desulfogranum japonicum]|uniref:LptF/LptG family permease n=1 Tax=Desulfogranum japonicum TaxID=231447 RepID=UPI000687BE2B|nr:LptF/LptG family permease [Desulfogranum japonicum]
MRLPRLPLLLYSYVATELLAPFFASFIILYSVFFLVRLIPLLEVVLELRIGFADFIRLFCYIFPHMLLYVIPMASMTGVIIGFTRLTNDREILAFKACGISLLRMLPPVVIIAATIATLTGFFSVHLIPAGEQNMKLLMFQLAKEKIDKGLKEKTFTEALGDLVVYVDDIDENDHWHGVYVSDMRDRDQPIITIAKAGRMEAEVKKMMVTIILEDGTLHNAEGVDNQVIRFEKYQLQIPLQAPKTVDGESMDQISRGALTQEQLIQMAERFGPDNKKGIVFLTEYWDRYVMPVGCFILSLLGLPLGLQAGPGKRAVGIPIGLGFFVGFYVVSTTCKVMVEDLVLPLLLGMWLPDIIFALLAIYIFYRVEREYPILPETVQNFLASIFDITIKPILYYLGLFMKWLLHRRTPVEVSDADTIGTKVHANATTKEYHLSQCENYTCSQCTIEFLSPEVAEESGFRPCSYCQTLLNNQKP